MKPETLKVWSIQPLSVWRRLQKEGIFTGRREFVKDEQFRAAYDWMTRQMKLRLHEDPPVPDAMPVWAWYQYDNSRKRKPDLRRSAHLPRGTKGARLTLTLDRTRTLLSDFTRWHHVLNASYLPSDQADHDAFERRSKAVLADECRKIVERSWDRIFDLNWGDDYIAVPFEEKSIQATVWQIRLDEVAQVEEFVAR